MTRGDIYMMDFGIPFGSEPGFRRPVMIIQTDRKNLNKLNTKLVIPLTSNTLPAEFPGNVFITQNDSNLPKDSVALVHQTMTIDKKRLCDCVGRVNRAVLEKIESAIDYIYIKNKNLTKTMFEKRTSMCTFQHEFVFAKLDYLQHSRPPAGTIAHPDSIITRELCLNVPARMAEKL